MANQRSGRVALVANVSSEEEALEHPMAARWALGRLLRYAMVVCVSVLLAGGLWARPSSSRCTPLPVDRGLQLIGAVAGLLERKYWVLILATCPISAVMDAFLRCRRPKAQEDPATKGNGVSREQVDHELSEQDFLSMGMPKEPHCEAGFQPATQLMHSNSAEPYRFDNEICTGQFLAIHRPTHDRQLDTSGKYRYGEHFSNKKRLWELRFRLQFKRPIRQEGLFFGNEMEEYVPMSAATQSVLNFTISALKMVVGELSYNSPGDPEDVVGERERPVITLPLWAFDQFIVTEEGRTPPELTDPNLHQLGEKRCGQLREYQRMMNELQLVPGPTFTFCIWGASRFLDIIQWQLAAPIPWVGALDLNLFVGKPPMHIVLYTLEDAGKETRHLQSRKRYLFRLSFWSSLKRPRHEAIRSFAGRSLEMLQGAVSTAESRLEDVYRAQLLPRIGLCSLNPLESCMSQEVQRASKRPLKLAA